MSNALSMDLRVRFKTLMDGGKSAAAAGKSLLLSCATAARWGKKVRDGQPLEPLPSGPRIGSGRLEPFLPFFLELIEQDPDITLAELQAAVLSAHDMTCSSSGIDGLLRRHGYAYKKRPDRRRAPQARGSKSKARRGPPPEGHARTTTPSDLSG